MNIICEYSSIINLHSLYELSILEDAAKCCIVVWISLLIQPSSLLLDQLSISSACLAWCYVLDDQLSQYTVHLTGRAHISLFAPWLHFIVYFAVSVKQEASLDCSVDCPLAYFLAELIQKPKTKINIYVRPESVSGQSTRWMIDYDWKGTQRESKVWCDSGAGVKWPIRERHKELDGERLASL